MSDCQMKKCYFLQNAPCWLSQQSNLCKTATLKKTKYGFQNQVHVSLNAGQKCCSMLQREHSAILLTFIKLPFVIKTFVLSMFEWPFYIGFTVVLFIKFSITQNYVGIVMKSCFKVEPSVKKKVLLHFLGCYC